MRLPVCGSLVKRYLKVSVTRAWRCGLFVAMAGGLAHLRVPCTALLAAAAVVLALAGENESATAQSSRVVDELARLAQRPAPLDDDPAFRASFAAEQERIARRNERRATPEARAERDWSRTAHAQLGAAEALALARDRFAGILRAELDPLAGLEVVSFLGDYTALVDQGPGEPDAVVESLLPLRTEAGPVETARVDLDLVGAGPDSLEPRNALAATRFPREAAGFVSVGSGVSLRLAGADEVSSGALTDGKLFYADAIDGASTDLLLIPHPAGLELLLQVRAAASPERYELAFDLPAGARLEQDAQGFVRVVDGLDVLTTISPPAAWDADQEPVPVSYEIQGSTLVVEVVHHGRDLLYPVLVDPVIEDQNWRDSPSTDHNGWRLQGGKGSFGHTFSGGDGAGIYLYNFGNPSNSHTYYHGDYTEYVFGAPGAGAGTDAYVNKAWFYIHHAPTGQDSCVSEGIRWIDSNGTWYWEEGRTYGDSTDNSPWNQCGEDWDARWHCLPRPSCETQPNTDTGAGTRGNSAALVFWMNGTRPRWGAAWVYFGGAQVWLGDHSPPTAPSFVNPYGGQWLDNGDTITTTITGTDQGLGVKTLKLHQPGTDPTATHACSGGRNDRCPASWRAAPNNAYTASIPYTVQNSWPEGQVTIGASAIDILGKGSNPTNTTVKVDHSKPTTEFGGSLYEHGAGQTVDHGVYKVRATGSDPHSGVVNVQLLLDGVELASATQPPCDGCSLAAEASVQTYTLSPGEHTVVAFATDRLGHASVPDRFTFFIPEGTPCPLDPFIDDPASPERPLGGLGLCAAWPL